MPTLDEVIQMTDAELEALTEEELRAVTEEAEQHISQIIGVQVRGNARILVLCRYLVSSGILTHGEAAAIAGSLLMYRKKLTEDHPHFADVAALTDEEV